MRSIGEARAKLPQPFIDKLYEYFSPLLADKILQGYTGIRYPSLRANTLKTDVRTVMRELAQYNIKYQRVTWYHDALVITSCTERELMQLPCYEKGEIYLQTLSSMLPPLILQPQPGEKILDLTAAPGSKTTQMAAIMGNQGQIIAVEIDYIRYQRLQYNIIKQGASIVQPVHDNGVIFGKKEANAFDKVLLDAPCSGEGLFLVNTPGTYRSWKQKLVDHCRHLQRKLLDTAIYAVKPKGYILYSTCTINPLENELIINDALKQYGDQLRVVAINIQLPNKMAGLTQIDNLTLNPSLANSIRIIPDKYWEGFYCCLLQKQY